MGRLGRLLGLDDDRRRMVLSFAVAIALIEVVCALLPLPVPLTPHERVVRVALTPVFRRAVPAPSSPPARIRSRRIARHPQMRARRAHAGAAPRAHAARAVRHRPKVLAAKSNRPPWESALAANRAPIPIGSAGAGASVQSGTGSGSVAGGAAVAGATAAAPCGAVDFVSTPVETPDAATGLYVYAGITMIVHFPDGHAQGVTLDWPWHYRDPAMDPFKHGDAPLFFQFPPAAVRANEPPLVQYVMAHTTPEGSTELDLCASAPPLPARTPPP